MKEEITSGGEALWKDQIGLWPNGRGHILPWCSDPFPNSHSPLFNYLKYVLWK